MKIEKVDIIGFGKLKKLVLEFSPGLNIIYGANESGKSTLQVFIKAMLYSLKGGKSSKDGMLPPLKKYRPWSGNDYRGSMVYRLDKGSVFTVERDFDKNSVVLYDSQFNNISNSFSQSREFGPLFALEHIGLNEECFEKTAFIGQMDTRLDSNGNRLLIDRISNIRQTGSEDISLKKAREALKNALIFCVGTDRTSTRPLDATISKINDLKLKKDKLLDERENLSIFNEKAQSIFDLKNLVEARKSLLKYFREVINARKDIEDLKLKKKELAEIHKQLSLMEKEKSMLDSILAEKEKEAKGYSKDYFKKEISMKEELIARSIKDEKFMKGGSIAAGLVAVLALVLGILGKAEFAGYIAALISGIVSVGLFILGAFTQKVRTAELESGLDYTLKQAEEYSQKSLKVQSEIKHINEMKEQIDKYSGLLFDRAALVCAAGPSVEEIKESLAYINGRIDELYKSIEHCIDKVSKINTEAIFDNSDCNELMEKILEAPLKEAEVLIEKQMNDLQESVSYLLVKIKEKDAKLKQCESIDLEIESIDTEIEELENAKARLEDMGFSLRTALEVLEESGVEIKRNFTPVLSEHLCDIANKITPSRYSDLKVDDNLLLMVKDSEYGNVVNAHALSGGTIDQLYLALRLALVKVMEKKDESVPVIMDEVFSQFDDERALNAMALLSELSSERQIIFFTCRQREADMARIVCKGNINIIKLE